MCINKSYTIMAIFLVGLGAGVASADIVSDLMGYWTLDGNANDSSGNEYHGEVFGDPAYVSGVMDQAMEFTGSEDSVYVENFTVLVEAPTVTICMWVMPYRNSGEDQVMWFNDEDGSYGRVRFGINGDEWEFKHGDGVGNPTPDDSENPILLNEWAHLAGVRENGVKLELFVNGVSVDEQDFGTAGLAEPQISIGAERRSSTSTRTPFEGVIDEVRFYTRALSASDVKELMEYRGLPPVRARNPQPADGSDDAPRDGLLLGWTPGNYAVKHNVYLGETATDVNEAGLGSDLLISENQDANSLVLGRLDLAKTYYWRVDEVNSAPDNTIFKGHVWRLEVEPVGVPVVPVTATASSSTGAFDAENTIDGSGLDPDDGTHSTLDTDMWISEDQGPDDPVSILYEFDRIYKLHEMTVWNSNQSMENVVGYGFKEMTITYSTNGAEWTRLGGEEGLVQLAQAPGDSGYTGQSIGLDNVVARYVKLTAVSNWSLFFNQCSLSEVQFTALPMSARRPVPDSGTGNVDPRTTVLSWRSGREAGQHDVFVSTDSDALGSAHTVLESSLALDTLDLSLDTTYYWQVNEVNETLVPSTWAGNLWSFTTLDSFVVDDFERYSNNSPDRPFQTWLDGYGYSADEFFPAGYGGNGTGAGIGHDIWSLSSPHYDGNLMETDSTIAGSSQSMPFYYSNSGGVASQTDRTFAVPQDWTVNGLQTLSIAFRGTPGNTGTLYARINDIKIPYDLSATDIALSAWQAWNIDLTTVTGSLSNVTTLSFGVDGANASGMILIDDIRLYAQPGEMITPAAPDSTGLLAHYTFEGNANDSSGHGLHGTLASSQIVSPGATGQGSAVQMTPGTYVDLGNPAALDFGTGDWTVTAWLKTGMTGTGDANKGTIIGKGGDGSGGHRFALIISENTEGAVTLVCDDNVTKIMANSVTPANDDQWHFVAGQRQGTEVRIFIDGLLEATETVDPGYDLSGMSQHNAYIGAITDNGSMARYKMLIGSVDEVAIYNRALSAGEILWLAGRTTPFHRPF